MKKKYHEYKTIQQAANAFAKSECWNRATALIPTGDEKPSLGGTKDFGYRKCTTGEYVPNSYVSNFGWKNTYYQHAVSEVNTPLDWYLWFGWRV